MLLPKEFHQDENLFRAIKPFPNWWDDETNKPTSAAFKDSNGVSADRQGERSIGESIDAMLNRFDVLKAIAYISSEDSIAVGAHPYYEPVEDNHYHSVLKQADGSIPLTSSVAKKLSRAVLISYKQE